MKIFSATVEARSAPSQCFLVAMEEGIPAHGTAMKKVAKHVLNLWEGDLVLLCCKDAPKVKLVTAKEGSMKRYQRPVTETILLKAEE